ncbi:J domain-containing protein [Pseudomonas mandelii]|uniref:J domain-containing protein n=1 Tax=Pseudomonas mandelii TaxID=75612 RepID=A0AB36CZY9_9PSED|nr:J domain-containing protein [Pseudomonas mandelii]NMZ81764.1 J domain-containing protein [Pseudomonas mandelii]
MDCWSVLELPEDADARTIKRSYARLLKTFRPDEDPEGFQRLREAYEEALGVAQWRAEYAAEEHEVATVDVVEKPNHTDLQAGSDVLGVRPLSLQNPPPLRPLNLESPPPLRSLNLAPSNPQPLHEPVAAPDELAARALLDGLSEQNLSERWAQAQQQHCAKAFEQRLLALCFDHPGLRNSIAAWAVQHLDWLAPWQNVEMTDWQRDALASGLLQDYRQALQELLEAGKEREFLTQLKSYTVQPWLQVFDRRQEWQRILLQLFNDTEWSLPLFDRVGQVFGWDDKKGIHPEPTSLWQALIERCNQESFYASLQAKAQDNRTWAADVQAAHLLMNPMQPGQQKKMIDGFGQNEWQACHDLAQTLKWRYPQLRLRLPHADVFHWRRFLPRPIADETWVRVWAGIALALFLFYFPTEYKSKGFSISIPMIFISLAFACVPVWFFRFAMSWWVPIISHVVVQDLWLTEGLVPRHWNPDTRWLVMRHGVPQAVLTLLFGLLLGWPGMATYVGFMLIGLLHKRRIGQLDPELAARRPWLTALHWAHFSPLQLVFLLVMVGVIFVCRMYFPEYHLTHLMFR